MNQRLMFVEDGIEFRELVTPDELQQAYHFRYQICVERLRWIPGDSLLQIEMDQWDPIAWHFGAFIDGELVAYVRLVPDTLELDIMSRRCFAGLLRHPYPPPPVDETGDISRLIFRPGLGRDHKRLARILSGLYRLAFGRARLQGIRYWYFVTSIQEIGALWIAKFPVKLLGNGITPDGNRTYIAILDLGKAARALRVFAPRKLAWYETAVDHLVPIPAQPRPSESAPPIESAPVDPKPLAA